MSSGTCILVVVFTSLSAGAAYGQTLVLEDPLNGSTSGAQGGGAFLPGGGWQVTNKNDSIYWHVPTLTAGAVEFKVRGLLPNDSRPEGEDKNEFFHMYDWTYNNADTVYDGYRNGPYKHFLRKSNVLNPGKVDSLECLWKIEPNYVEPDTAVLSWDPNFTYTFREEWGPDASGNSEIRTYRDGVLLMTMSLPGSWAPAGHAVRIAASTRAPLYPDFGAPVGAVFSAVKVWDLRGPGRDNPNGNDTLNDRCGLLGAEALLLLLAARARRPGRRGRGPTRC